jgi:nucleoside 2-deoxyribosyltransferase
LVKETIMPIDIYFAAPVTAGREDAQCYKEIIEFLKRFGNVLTEHIGDPNLGTSGEAISSLEIFRRDMDWLKSADVVIAEVSGTSHGVGYELGGAIEAFHKPTLCLYCKAPGKRLSAMIAGNPAIRVVEYIHDFKEVEDVVASFLYDVGFSLL